MTYFYYNDLIQPSQSIIENEDQSAEIALDNFRESLDKKSGYNFNYLINNLNTENIDYDVVNGFDYKSDDKEISNFKKISFNFKKVKDIDSFIKKYNIDQIFNIEKDKKNYTFIIKE